MKSRVTLPELLSIAVLILAGFIAYPQVRLYRLEHSDPIRDATRAANTLHPRFLVISSDMGFTIPGAERVLNEDAFRTCRVRSIANTESRERVGYRARYMLAAVNYARSYNSTLLRIKPLAELCPREAA